MTNLGKEMTLRHVPDEERAPNDAITYAAALLVNWQFTGARDGYGSRAAETVDGAHTKVFSSLSHEDQATAVTLARDTERDLPLFQSLDEVLAANYAVMSANQH